MINFLVYLFESLICDDGIGKLASNFILGTRQCFQGFFNFIENFFWGFVVFTHLIQFILQLKM